MERGLHALAFFWVHAAIDESQPVAPEAVRCEDLLHPLLSGAILREQDHSFIRPSVTVLQVTGQPIQYGGGLGVGPTSRLLSPGSQPVKHPAFFVGRWPDVLACFLNRFRLGGVALRVVRVVLFGLGYRSPKNAVIEFFLAAVANRATFDRRYMPLQRGGERSRR